MFTKKKLWIKYEKNITWFRVDKATLIYFYSLQIHRRDFLEKKIKNFFHMDFIYILFADVTIFS